MSNVEIIGYFLFCMFSVSSGIGSTLQKDDYKVVAGDMETKSITSVQSTGPVWYVK